jgi:hypothetical protein
MLAYFNYKYLTDLVNNGKVNYVLKDKGETKINLENALFFRGTRLMHGDVIIRKDESGCEKELVVNNGKDMLKPGDRLKRNGEFITDIKYPEKYKNVIDRVKIILKKHILKGMITLRIIRITYILL